MGSKSDATYMEKALTEIELIRQFTNELTYEQYISDIETIYTTVFTSGHDGVFFCNNCA